MSKKISLIVLALALVLVMVIPSSRVFAADLKVKTVEISEANNKITVSGEVDAGMLAVSVQLLDKDGKLIKLVSGPVDSSNKYSVELDAAQSKDYIVKVANFDGGDTVTKNVLKDIDITLEAPVEGTEITVENVNQGGMGYTEQKNGPKATAADGANYTITDAYWNYGIDGKLPTGKTLYEMFEGTIEKDGEYYAVIEIEAKDGYALPTNLNIKVNGEAPAEVFAVYNNATTHFIAKIKATEKAAEATTTNTTEDDATEVTPKTGDNISIFFIIFTVAAVGTVAVIALNRKTVKTKKVSKH